MESCFCSMRVASRLVVLVSAVAVLSLARASLASSSESLGSAPAIARLEARQRINNPRGKFIRGESIIQVVPPADTSRRHGFTSDSSERDSIIAGDGSAGIPGLADKDHASVARWLVARSTWGIISTLSQHLNGSPFGNVVSFSDGTPSNYTGTPYFYLTPLDPSAADVAADPRASLALSAMPLGTCGDADPESPLCAKLTLSGELVRVSHSDELSFAKHALFTRHPEMETWPKDHHFSVFKLVLSNVFFINGFGGPKRITVEQYYSASPDVIVPLHSG